MNHPHHQKQKHKKSALLTSHSDWPFKKEDLLRVQRKRSLVSKSRGPDKPKASFKKSHFFKDVVSSW